MAREVYAETDACTISWDDEIDAIVNEWHDYAEGEDYRKVFDISLDLVEERNARKLLGDCRDLGPVSEDDQRWMQEEWGPRAQEAGVEYSAVIYPESVIAKMAVDKMTEASGDVPVDIRATDDIREAREWLAEQ